MSQEISAATTATKDIEVPAVKTLMSSFLTSLNTSAETAGINAISV